MTSHDAEGRGRRAQPQQSRSHAKVEAILQAARQILTDPAAQPLTIRNLADRLGFSTGVIYRYFESLDAIAEAVVREHAELTERGLADLLARIEPDTAEQLFGQVFQFFINFHADNPESAGSGLNGELAIRYLEVERASNEESIRMVLKRGRDLGVLGAGRRIEIRVRLLWFAAEEAVLNSFADDPGGDQMLFEEIRRMIRALNTNPEGNYEQ
ncbi:MAG: TetR/AcrR family transcriptional regulator [Actinomycetia bacterium]|nr:TetR/AcrR family transcriptional regulator [Actinomycetes bacterium]